MTDFICHYCGEAHIKEGAWFQDGPLIRPICADCDRLMIPYLIQEGHHMNSTCKSHTELADSLSALFSDSEEGGGVRVNPPPAYEPQPLCRVDPGDSDARHVYICSVVDEREETFLYLDDRLKKPLERQAVDELRRIARWHGQLADRIDARIASDG